jgi:3-oxoacyl-(acyl-carrier-protein) synthase
VKIVLSGIGLLSPAGNNYHSFIESIYAGTSFVSLENELSQYGTRCEVSSRIQNFKLSSKWKKYQSSTPLSLQYALNSALHAYKDAQLERSAASYTRGISFSTTMTNLWPSFDDNTPNTELHTPAILLARELGFLGPTTCQSIGSSAGIDALGLAIKTIQRGECDMMLVGATSQALCPLTFSAYDKMGCLSRAEGEPSTRSRPFDLTRKGFVFSEGSAFLVIETLESALKRNAPIYAEILSYASICNGEHLVELDPESPQLARVIRRAIQKAKVNRIDYIQAHGSSTQQNDLLETNSIKNVFGKYAYEIPISSIKSTIGHTTAAASLLSVITSIGAIQRQEVPPTMHLHTPDPLCDLDYVPNSPRKHTVEYTLNISSSFGGIHSAIILGKHS